MSNGEDKSWVTGVMDKVGMSKAEQARLRYKMDENKKKKDLEIQKSKADKIKQENIDKKAAEKTFKANVSEGVKNLAQHKKQENKQKGPTENVISAESSKLDSPAMNIEETKSSQEGMDPNYKDPEKGVYDTIADVGHTALEALGQIPAVGAIPDAINAAWYRGEEIANVVNPGMFPNAKSNKNWALGAVVPIAGQGATTAKWGQKILMNTAGSKHISSLAHSGTGKMGSIMTRLSGGDGVSAPPINKGKYPT